MVAVLSTATIALLPYDSGLRNWAAGHIGHWTPAVGQVAPVVGPRLGYVAGNSAFAAGYLFVLVLGPVFGCGFGAWGGRVMGRHYRADSRGLGVSVRCRPRLSWTPGIRGRGGPCWPPGARLGRGDGGLLRDPRLWVGRAVRTQDPARPARPRGRLSDHYVAGRSSRPRAPAGRSGFADSGRGLERGHRGRQPFWLVGSTAPCWP